MVRQRVTHWDLDQFMHAIDLLTDGDPSQDLKKRLNLAKYQAAGGDHADAVAALIGATIASTTERVHKNSRQHLANDYGAEQHYQKVIASKNLVWTLPHDQGVQITRAIGRVIDDSDWSATLWNHSDNMTADVQKVVRDSLNGGLQQDQLNKLLAQLTPGQVAKGNIFSAGETRMWMVDRLIRTESARVVDKATRDALKNRHIKLVVVVGEPDACKDCKKMIAHGPYTLDDGPSEYDKCPILPIHPNDRCKIREYEPAPI